MPPKTKPENRVRNSSLRRPEWLKVRYGSGQKFTNVRRLVNSSSLHTVCESARCPNLGECWNRGTATFMILGNTCTRSCTFCNIHVGKPTEYDLDEPQRVADAVSEMKLNHAVITMVARDDLPDSGAFIIAETIRKVHAARAECSVEVLISDLKGDRADLRTVLEAKPEILNHNMETVRRLQKALRVQANYQRSLQMLDWAYADGFTTKSGVMLGVGETFEEIVEVMTDLREISVSILTIGQYLPPTREHYPLDRFYHPDEFADLKELALEMGFSHVESGPLVRSSYHAEEHIEGK